MGMMYVPDRFVERVRLTICELKTKELRERLREAMGKDERTNKEKSNKKENKKKEERTNQPAREALSASVMEMTAEQRPTMQDGAGLSSRPTMQEVSDEVSDKGYDIDAQTFYDYYESLGWMGAGNRPVRNWQALLRTWSHYDQRVNVRPVPRRACSKVEPGVQKRVEGVAAVSAVPVERSRGQEVEMFVGRDSQQVKWMARMVAEAADRTSTPVEDYPARQIVDDVRLVVSMPDVYTGLSEQRVLSLLADIDTPLSSDVLLGYLYEKRQVG